MFKSIFRRLLVTHLLIAIGVVVTLSFTISFVYKNSLFNQERLNLERVAIRVNALTQNYMDGTMTNGELSAAVNAMGESSETIIYVLKISPEEWALKPSLSVDGLNDNFVGEALESVLKGDTIFIEQIYSKDFDTFVLLTGHPLLKRSETGAENKPEIIGAVLLLTPVSDINRQISKMTIIIWSVALGVILISLPFISYSARGISRPIQAIDLAARQLATGEMSKPVSINSKDEIGTLAKSFEVMRHELEKTEQLRKEWIANVSHEIRTPLTSINGFVQSILDGIVAQQAQRDVLLIIQDETKRLITLSSSLLTLAKLQSGSGKLTPITLKLFEIADAIRFIFIPQLNKKNLKLDLQINPMTEIFADENAVKQILINVIANAIKYSPEGDLIQLSATQKEDKVMVCVRDHGIGISEESLPHIFEKFYRFEAAGRDTETGAGLGLAIAKELVLLSGGEIWVESILREGTTVNIVLPSNSKQL